MKVANILQNDQELTTKFDKKGYFFVFLGIFTRIIMLFYYYYTHIIDPERDWGDCGLYFQDNLTSPPLSIILLEVFRFLSFGTIMIFVFWCFIWDLIVCLVFYYVLKSFNIKNRKYAYGLFLINPFFFLNNSFSLINCGYHITDAFFLFFLLNAYIYIPKREKYAKYLFYLFLGLSICAKYYSLPALVLLFIKALYQKNWNDIKLIFIIAIPLCLIFLLIPFFYFPSFSNAFNRYPTIGILPQIPLYIKILPSVILILIFIIFRLKKSNPLEISIISIISMALLLFFIFPFIRWFQVILFYGILKEKDYFTLELKIGFIKKKVIINNHLLTFYLSFIGVLFAYIIIIIKI